MAPLPAISIITPSFNQGRFIERTIRSVLDQNYPGLEYIVVDGGSTDETVEILKKYGDRLSWTSEKDRGQTDAINKGIRKASGEIIAYLNSDDVYEPGALQRIGTFFRDHPDRMWATGRCRIIDEEDRDVRGAITAYKNFLLRRYSYSLLLVTNPISQPATFWRRQVMGEIGPFDENEHYVMDYDFWLRVGKVYQPAVLDDYLAAFRVYTTSKTSSAFLSSFRRELEVAKKHSSSPVLNALHWANYLGISAVYLALNAIGRVKGKR
ncbi:MAG: glycosyltransferase family 2 protein [Nitrospiraceae bacterium]|nr:glycosyltransferase family 2 protein [Nitrospiraceae bacterium]